MSKEQSLVPLSDRAGWDAALGHLPHGPCHTHWFNLAVAETHGQPVFLYFYFDSDDGVAAAPLVEREFQGSRDLYSPYGNNGFLSVGQCNDFWNDHRDFMASEGFVCAHISMNQVTPCTNLFPQEVLEEIKPVYVVDTTQDEETLWRLFGRNNRRHLNRWRETEEVEILEDSDELRDTFLKTYPEFAERIGVSARQRLNQDTLSGILDNDQYVKLIGIREPSGEIDFVRCFLFSGTTAEAFLEVSVAEGRRHSRAVYWHAYQWANAANISSLNLSGGISTGDSLEFFKKSLGGEKRTLYRARLVYNQERYNSICADVGVSGTLEPQAFFPPYREV